MSSCRCWSHLDPKATYIIRAENGWYLSMNGDGTVSMIHNGNPGDGGGKNDMTIDPDPGEGDDPPPGQ